MLLLYALFLLPGLVATETVHPTTVGESFHPRVGDSRDIAHWMREGLLDAVHAFLPVSQTTVEARKRKKYKLNKYILPLIIGFMLIKSILLPVALKALAVLSGKAVVLSLMSLILAAIVGLKKVAQSPSGGNHETVNVPSGKYRRQDTYDFVDDAGESEPYKYYKERRRKK